MALFVPPNSPLLLLRNPKPHHRPSTLKPPTLSPISISTPLYPSPFRINSSLSNDEFDPNPSPSPSPIPTNPTDSNPKSPPKITDEWGEEAEPDLEANPSDADPPRDEDEWGSDGGSGGYGGSGSGYGDGNGSASAVVGDDRVGDLKRCLVDTFYGTELGFRASPEVRAEVLELVNQLEAVNPTPVPTEEAGLLDGNWVLLYTAFSELLPLLATGSIPLLKVKRICQAIDSKNLTIENSTTLSSPVADFSFSASATFEVRSPTRIQVQFKEGILKPPEIQSNIALPGNIDIFGQKIDLQPLQSSLNPLQEAIANLSRGLSGQPPLKLPLPGNRPSSWLIITYLDDDLRISRGDGGLFILAKEGSPLLDQ